MWPSRSFKGIRQWCHSIGHIRFPISVPLQLCLYLSLSCTDNEILSLISQNLKKSRDTSHVPFEDNISRMHKHSCVSISKLNFKCLASPFPKIWLKQNAIVKCDIRLQSPRPAIDRQHNLPPIQPAAAAAVRECLSTQYTRLEQQSTLIKPARVQNVTEAQTRPTDLRLLWSNWLTIHDQSMRRRLPTTSQCIGLGLQKHWMH